MTLPTRAVAAFALMLAGVGIALAHGGATGIVKERMDAMVEMDRAMKALVVIVRAGPPFDGGEVARLAGVLSDHSGDDLLDGFPEGTGHAPSEALPAVWSAWDGFAAQAAQLQLLADALAERAEDDFNGATAPEPYPIAGIDLVDGDLAASLPARILVAHMSETCSACHADYRAR